MHSNILNQMTKGKGHLTQNAARKALNEGARVLSNLLAPSWESNKRVTRKCAAEPRNRCSDEEHFEEAMKIAAM